MVAGPLDRPFAPGLASKIFLVFSPLVPYNKTMQTNRQKRGETIL